MKDVYGTRIRAYRREGDSTMVKRRRPVAVAAICNMRSARRKC